MSLSNYAEACTGFVWELKESLTTEDLDGLRADCASLGLNRWTQWTKENINEICQYVAASPSQRLKKKKWQENNFHRRLVFGSLHHVLFARAMFLKIDEYRLKPGGSYRDLAASAGLAFYELFFEEYSAWPLPGENPFAKKSPG